MARAEMLTGAGLRLKDEGLLRAAVGDLAAAAERLDTAYEPLTLGRVAMARAAARASLSELTGDIDGLAKGVSELASALDGVNRDHSPLDWARGQTALAQALSQLGEATSSESAFDKAVAGFDRAAVALADAPGLLLRAQVAAGRGLCLARSAELTGDLGTLDAAEAAFKTELIAGPHRRNPVAWAMLQVQLGQLYATRLSLTGKDRGERAAAALAFQAAMDVFGEEGLRSFTAIAADGLERLAAVKVS
jgi:tetratricopeptide (TPR) repeat protein